MAKHDLTQLKETAVPNTRSKEKVDHEKALKALAEAKKKKGTARFAKQGEGEFSRELANSKSDRKEIADLYSIKEAADYLGIKQTNFYSRSMSYKLPFVSVKKKKYFTQETLDDHKENTIFKTKSSC